MSQELPTVTVVIVNYRTKDLVVDCLKSLEPEIRSLPGSRVAIVDNDSGDGSAETISQAITANDWSAWASLIQAPRNGGFAYGNNLAFQAGMESAAPPDLFWMLNPDTVIRPGALRTLTEFMANTPSASICGGGIEEANGEHWPFAFRFHTIRSEVERGAAFGPISKLLSRRIVARRMGPEPAIVDWVSGATMMVRRSTLERVGLMDEHYFLYFEEADYCLQAHRAGLQCWYVPGSRIMHIAGQSTGVTAKIDAPQRIPAYWFESRRRYFTKNHGRLYAVVADIAWTVSFCFGQFVRWLQRKPRDATPRLLRDFLRHSSLWNAHSSSTAETNRAPASSRSGAA